MTTKQIKLSIAGAAALVIIGYTFYKAARGQPIGSSEVYSLAFVLSLFLSAAAAFRLHHAPHKKGCPSVIFDDFWDSPSN